MVKSMRQRTEDVMAKYSLGELQEEEVQETNPDAWLPEGSLDHREPSMYARFRESHPEPKPAPKPLLKDLGPQISPDGTKAGEIIERLQQQLETLSKGAEEREQRLGDFILKANKCTNQGCRLFGKLHIHMGG